MVSSPDSNPKTAHSALIDPIKPGQLFEGLLRPVRLSAHAAAAKTVVDLPNVGEVKAIIWRGVYFAIPSASSVAQISTPVSIDEQGLSNISGWLRNGMRPFSFEISRIGDRVETISKSYRNDPDSSFATTLVFSRQGEADPQLESIALTMKLGDPTKLQTTLDYAVKRDETPSGQIQLEGPGKSFLFNHIDKFFILDEKNKIKGESRSDYPSVKEVLSRLLAVNERPKSIISNGNIFEPLRAVGMPEMVLSHLS